MNISENIMWITKNIELWGFFTNKSFQASVQLANSQRVYNVIGKPGIVYNILEDAYEKVVDSGYVVTGIKDEMWIINKNSLDKYGVTPDEITEIPVKVNTVEVNTVYAAIMIPTKIQFTLEVNYGEKAILKGNRLGIDHGNGDYILLLTKHINGFYFPDFDDSGRIINGSIFNKLYKKCRVEASLLHHLIQS